MRPAVSKMPRDLVAAAVRECLRLPGRPVRDIPKAASHAGDLAARPFRDRPVWHSKPDIDRCIAARLKLDPAKVLGPHRDDNELYAAVAAEISRLRRRGAIQDWQAGSGLGVWRLTGSPLPPSAGDLSMSTDEDGPFSGGSAGGPSGSQAQMYCVFAGIMRSGRKDNTYKLALARALLDYCQRNREDGASRLAVPYRLLALRFAEYYWRLDRVFGLAQTPKKRTPAAVKAVRSVRPNDPPVLYRDLGGADRARVQSAILKSVFGHARNKTSLVVPRFQNVACGPGRGGAGWRVEPNPVFYEYSDDGQEIRLRPEAYDFFRDHYHTLMSVVLYGWAEFVEKCNPRPAVDAVLDSALPVPAARPREAARPNMHMENGAAGGPVCPLCGGPCGPPRRLAAWATVFGHDADRLARPCPACGLPRIAEPPEPSCACRSAAR